MCLLGRVPGLGLRPSRQIVRQAPARRHGTAESSRHDHGQSCSSDGSAAPGKAGLPPNPSLPEAATTTTIAVVKQAMSWRDSPSRRTVLALCLLYGRREHGASQRVVQARLPAGAARPKVCGDVRVQANRDLLLGGRLLPATPTADAFNEFRIHHRSGPGASEPGVVQLLVSGSAAIPALIADIFLGRRHDRVMLQLRHFCAPSRALALLYAHHDTVACARRVPRSRTPCSIEPDSTTLRGPAQVDTQRRLPPLSTLYGPAARAATVCREYDH